MVIVFPSTKMPINSYRFRKKKDALTQMDKKFTDDMKNAGMDMDSRKWFFSYSLRGGKEGSFSISGILIDRLFKAVQRRPANQPFVVFDSDSKRIIINLDHLIYCQFLFEKPELENENDEIEDSEYAINVYTIDRPNSFDFDVDPDEFDIDTVEGETAELENVQFQKIVYETEKFGYDNDAIMFTDSDGETAFFRTRDVAMMEIPIEVVEPSISEADND